MILIRQLGGALQMKMIGAMPTFRSSRNPLVAFGLIVLVGYGAYRTAEAILADDLIMLAYAAVFFVCAVLLIAILNDWRRGLYVFFAWILFEDFVRKYLGNNMGIYFAKDILVLVLYLAFFRARLENRVAEFRIPFRVPLMLFFWLAALQMLNPASTSIFYGILGMKVDFLYVPLIFVGYALIQSEEDLRRFFSFTSVLIIIVAGLGLAQSIIGPTFLNPVYLQEDIRGMSTSYRMAPISGLVAYRPNSVFVSIGRFQDFLIVSWLISLSFGGYLLVRSLRGRKLAFTTVGIVAAASLMCTSRGVFMWNAGIALVVFAGFLWGAPWKRKEALRLIGAIQKTALVVGIAIVLLLTIFPEELGSRLAIYSETLMPNSAKSELVQRTRDYPLANFAVAFNDSRWAYGYGFGTATLGVQYVTRIMHVSPMGVAVESGYGNWIVELGILGLILFIVLGLGITLSAWKVVKQLRGSPWYPIGFSIFLFSALLFFPMSFVSFSTYQDFVINAYLWLLLGMLYRLPALARVDQLAEQKAISRKE
jgi:hypothetical protein